MATGGVGIALHDCVLVAASAPLALVAFYAHMDARAPMNAIRVALASAVAGIASLAGAGLIGLMVVAAMHGLWQPVEGQALAHAWLLAALFAIVVVSSTKRAAGDEPGSRWTIPSVVAGAGIAWLLSAQGAGWAPCTFALTTAALMAWAGWRLVHEVASELLRSGMER